MIEETEGEMEYRIEDETMADAMDIATVIICLVVLFMFTSCCLWLLPLPHGTVFAKGISTKTAPLGVTTKHHHQQLPIKRR